MKQSILCTLILLSQLGTAQTFAPPFAPFGTLIAGIYEPDPAFNDLTVVPDYRGQKYVPRIQKLLSQIKNRYDTMANVNIIVDEISSNPIGSDWSLPKWLRRNGFQYNYYVSCDYQLQETVLLIYVGKIGAPAGNSIIFDYDHLTE